MNTYIAHMLQRAREVHEINNGATGRDSTVKCPFCIADEDENWFRQTNHWPAFGFKPPKERPENVGPPHCASCPLLNISHLALGFRDLQTLMDDCIAIGKWMLEQYEETTDGWDNYDDLLTELAEGKLDV